MRTIQFYRTNRDQCPVEEFLRTLDDRTLAKILAVFKLVESQAMVPAQYFKKLSGQELWEVRVSSAGQIYRFLGFWDKGNLVILTHGFEKKTHKTPEQEIRQAKEYKADWQRRTK